MNWTFSQLIENFRYVIINPSIIFLGSGAYGEYIYRSFSSNSSLGKKIVASLLIFYISLLIVLEFALVVAPPYGSGMTTLDCFKWYFSQLSCQPIVVIVVAIPLSIIGYASGVIVEATLVSVIVKLKNEDKQSINQDPPENAYRGDDKYEFALSQSKILKTLVSQSLMRAILFGALGVSMLYESITNILLSR